MPSFVVMPDPGGGLKGGVPAWGSGFLPATYQATPVRPGPNPILHLWHPEVSEETAEELAKQVVSASGSDSAPETLQRALSDYCLAVLNSNAFVWVD